MECRSDVSARVNAVLRVAFRVPRDRAEDARVLLDLVPEGFEELEVDSEVELAAYVDAEGERALGAVFPGARATAVEPGWEDAWRRFHRPVEVGGVWIGPLWERPPPDIPAVLIEPGRAFGTGRTRRRGSASSTWLASSLAACSTSAVGRAWWRWQLRDWGTSRLRRSTSTPSPSNAHGTTPLATTFRSTWPSWTPSSTSCRRHALPWSTSFVPRSRACSRVSTWPSPSRPATSPPRHRPRPAGARAARARRLGGRRPCASASAARRARFALGGDVLGPVSRLQGVVCGCAGDS